ncbi:MAG: hypothetical protein KME42_03210 [Tildeniella nuda ZEHNDER 1965/U140]|jgi:hypothetical protein|nr:hypothetical protein [Tildeniella nuda ZEHNDER 1965/U140]
MVDSVNAPGQRLERYTEKRPQEVLLVTVDLEGERDQVAIFRGFSSSLVRSTAFDPDLPVLPGHAVIQSIDRLQSPYDPSSPRYIQQGITWAAMQPLLEALDV